MSEFEYNYCDPFGDIEAYHDKEAAETAYYDTIQRWVEAGVYTQEQGEELFMDWLNRR